MMMNKPAIFWRSSGRAAPVAPELTIARGETLTFTNDDAFIHPIYATGLLELEEKSRGKSR